MEVRVVIRDEKLTGLLSELNNVERRFVVETAMLYYAKYLEDNPQIIDPTIDITKLPCNQGVDFSKNIELRNQGKISEDQEISCNILKYAIDRQRENMLKEKSKSDERTTINIRFITNIEKIEQMLTYAHGRNSDLIQSALLCYIYILETDPRIVDFRLKVISKNQAM